MKVQRVLLVSCSVILLCTCIIAGMSYALFTDSVSVQNHLKAGSLDVSLKRTDLTYCVLNADGELAETTVTEALDLTSSTDENVFGIQSADIRIVPGSYFDATLEIANAGNTAFVYYIGLQLLGDSNALAEQLKVVLTHPDGTQTEKRLSELANGLSIEAGRLQVGDRAQQFHVRVEFLDDVAYNANQPEATMDNDLAQAQSAVFDLVVTAVQATAQE